MSDVVTWLKLAHVPLIFVNLGIFWKKYCAAETLLPQSSVNRKWFGKQRGYKIKYKSMGKYIDFIQ